MKQMEAKILKQLYMQMLRIREIEEKIAELYPEQEMRCPTHLHIGQEAISAGVCANLSNNDYVLSGHRCHGHYIAKQGDIRAMIAELYGKVTGCSMGKGGSMHLLDLSVGYLGSSPIVGSTIPIAVGTAFGSVMRNEHSITVVFFGEAATETGVFHESLNFAALHSLPIIFVCENNFYCVYSPLSVRQPENREVYELAKGHGIESYQSDGNDVCEVYELSKTAIKKLRNGHGPIFLEFMTYRWREHCGPYYDNDLGYRTKEEFEEWEKRCPIKRFRQFLTTSKIVDQKEFKRIGNIVNKEIEEAFTFAKTSPFPNPELLEEGIYAS